MNTTEKHLSSFSSWFGPCNKDACQLGAPSTCVRVSLAFLGCHITQCGNILCDMWWRKFATFKVMHQSGLAGLSGLCRVTEHLYLSNGRAACDSSQLTGNGITCIINVTETKSRSPPLGVEYIHISISDSPLSLLRDHFDEVADKIETTAERCGRTLVHCNAGVSRSAALCMAYLMRHRGATLLEAHSRVKSCRPVVRPNNGFWKQLIQYETELRGCSSVRMVYSSIGEIPDLYEQESRNMVPLWGNIVVRTDLRVGGTWCSRTVASATKQLSS